ncbi:Asp23/Gls24 family envelope stress response protein [Frondihabitans sp. PAMC 28766]|uniref:Asp23/Gls24 family envelope stress response protein n=1 Tax=Frondihabitans sp. PAMC 28766 TaxID=1795630 RepID=UPI0009E8CD97
MADITPNTVPHTEHRGAAATPVVAVSTTPVSAAPVDLDDGKTVIQENVVAKIAGIAARGVPGVYALGGGVARAFGVLRDATNNTDLTQGVSVQVGENDVTADLSLVVLYPAKIHEVAAEARKAVIEAITDLAGMDVVEVNVTITDVHIPDDDDEAPTATTAVTDTVGSAKAAVASSVNDVMDTATQKLDETKAVVSDKVDDAKDSVADATDQIKGN